jgi:hypothetical protein
VRMVQDKEQGSRTGAMTPDPHSPSRRYP